MVVTKGVSMDQPYKKVTFDFPAEEYMYLKMACAKQGVSMKDFLTKATVESVENYEDDLLCIKIKNTPKDNEPTISLDELKRQLGWDTL